MDGGSGMMTYHVYLKLRLATDSRLKIPAIWFMFIDNTVCHIVSKTIQTIILDSTAGQRLRKLCNDVDMQFVGNKPP